MTTYLCVLLLVAALPVSAATVHSFHIEREGMIAVPIYLNPDGACVNAVALTVSYDPLRYRPVGIGTAGSFISLWIDDAYEDDAPGTVTLIGGVIGGKCGVVAAEFATLYVRRVDPAASSQEHPFTLTAAMVLLHDGRGTSAPLSVGVW